MLCALLSYFEWRHCTGISTACHNAVLFSASVIGAENSAARVVLFYALCFGIIYAMALTAELIIFYLSYVPQPQPAAPARPDAPVADAGRVVASVRRDQESTRYTTSSARLGDTTSACTRHYPDTFRTPAYQA